MQILLASGPAHIAPASTAPWLAQQIADLAQAIHDHTATGCRHLARTTGPCVTHAAVWQPWHLVCPACIHALTPNPHDANRCDQCNQPTNRFISGATIAGPVLIAFALCPTCADRTGINRKDTPR